MSVLQMLRIYKFELADARAELGQFALKLGPPEKWTMADIVAIKERFAKIRGMEAVLGLTAIEIAELCDEAKLDRAQLEHLAKTKIFGHK